MPKYRIEIVDNYTDILQTNLNSCPVCEDRMKEIKLDINSKKDYGPIMMFMCKCSTIWKFMRK